MASLVHELDDVLESVGFDLEGVRRGLAGVLFLQAATNAMDVYSAVNSSPWTAETVTGGDPVNEASLKRYCTHAVVQTVIIDGLAAVIAGPGLAKYVVLGAGLEVAYMSWLYYDAVQRGRSKKSKSWDLKR